MDWSALVPVLANLAPVAGKIIGGALPIPFAGFVAEQFGNAIAAKFGTAGKTPQETAKAIQADPLALKKIDQVMEESRTRIQGFVEVEKAAMEAVMESLRQTGQTMRVEILPENRHWFFTGWRPFIGWTFAIMAAGFGAMLLMGAVAAVMLNDERPLELLGKHWPLFLAYFGVLGLVVGVFIPSRSYEKAVEKQIAVDAVKKEVRK